MKSHAQWWPQRFCGETSLNRCERAGFIRGIAYLCPHIIRGGSFSLKRAAVEEAIFAHYANRPHLAPTTDNVYIRSNHFTEDLQRYDGKRVPILDAEIDAETNLNAIGDRIVDLWLAGNHEGWLSSKLGVLLGQCILPRVKGSFIVKPPLEPVLSEIFLSHRDSPGRDGVMQIIGSECLVIGKLLALHEWARISFVDPLEDEILPLLPRIVLPRNQQNGVENTIIDVLLTSRVVVEIGFVYEGSVRRFKALIDTGGPDSLMPGSCGARTSGEVYHFQGQKILEERPDHDCQYGVLECIKTYRVERVIQDTIVLYSNSDVMFPIIDEGIKLIKPSPSNQVRESLIGASKSSIFAMQSKVFALIPTGPRIVIGREYVSRHIAGLKCEKLDAFPETRTYWAVQGSLGIDNIEKNAIWIIDTGAPYYYVTDVVHAALCDHILHLGYEITEKNSVKFISDDLEVALTSEQMRLLPPYKYTIGSTENPVIVHMSPHEYIHGLRLLVVIGKVHSQYPKISTVCNHF